MVDPLIRILKERYEVLELLGRVWELLYIEGRAPDVGKRRENFIKLLFKYELNLEIISAPDTERSWDFRIKLGNRWRTYSLKTSERPTIIKVAWNGFPSWERVESFTYEYPILYIVGDRSSKVIEVFVFSRKLIKKLRRELDKDFWWVPRRGTKPRGFGISSRAVRELMNEAKREGNYVSKKYKLAFDLETISEEYWKGWYNLLRRLAGFQ